MKKSFMIIVCALLGACSGDDAPRGAVRVSGGETAFTVNGDAVPQSVLAAVAAGRALDLAKPADRERAARELADYVLLAQAARRDNAEADDAFAAEAEAARLQGVANAAFARYTREHPISDETVKAEYDKQIAKAGSHVYDFTQLLFENDADANAAAAELAAGKKFGDVYVAWQGKAKQARTFKSTRLSQLPAPELADALQMLKPGEATNAPIKTRFGWHLLYLDAVNPFAPLPFERVKDELRKLLAQKQIDAYIADLRSKAAIDGPAAPAAAPAALPAN